MNVSEKISEASSPTPLRPEGCPLAAMAPVPEKHAPADRITFGMDISTSAGCCVAKIKTGRTGGCCAHIPREKFVEGYKAAIRREFEKTGVQPRLDPELEAILTGGEKPQPAEETPSLPAERKKFSLKRALLKPFQEIGRFFKWLFIGLWKDLKQIVTRKPVA